MLQFNSALLALAGLFTGSMAPYQAIHVQPHDNGVIVFASDQGRVTFLGFDPNGFADEDCHLLPDRKLLDACAGIKSAERDVTIEGCTAKVTTYRKTAGNDIKTLTLLFSSTDVPPISKALQACVQHWSKAPPLSTTAGRYDTAFVTRAIKAAGLHSDSIVFSGYDGGPMRLHCQSIEMLILVMPQTAEPIPVLPDWICSFANREQRTAGA